MGHTMLFLSVLLVLLEATRMSVQTPVFYGGYINYDLEKLNGTNMYKAQVQVITGWELGTGPCGDNCKVNRVGTSTLDTRRLKGTFGNYTWDARINQTTISGVSINDVVTNTMQEVVLDVSESEQWEQDVATFTLELNGTLDLDINVDGNYWRHLTLPVQSSLSLPWHLQTQIKPNVRIDTKQPNRAPKFLPKPFYRILLNKTTTIHFPVYDEDYDLVKCQKSQGIELGSLTYPDGITVSTNCSVTIAALQRYRYENDSWIGIPISVRDFQKTSPDFGALSSSSLVFIVHVTTLIVGPQFISPTEAAATKFILYIDSAFLMEVFAKSSDGVEISKFNTLHLRNESITMSELKPDPEGRDNIKYVELKWTPSKADIGHHIVCLTVTDSIQVTSNERRCFNLQVKDRLSGEWQNPALLPTTDPYFLEFPNGSFSCPKDVYCTIPLFVDSERELKDIIITRNYLNSATLTFPRNVTHNGTMLYTSDLTFRNFSIGDGPICLQATDLGGYTSREICINVHVFPPNPCLSSPCINSGTCEPDNDDSGLFKCICPEHYFGRLCSQLNKVCTVGICNHGLCIPNGNKYSCYCTDDDGNGNLYTTPNCLNKNNTCLSNTCGSNELCVDGISKYTCIERPPQTHSNSVADLCSSPCSNGGVCKGGTCICRLGFSGDNCSHVPVGSALDLQRKVQFVDPTPRPGSRIVCYSEHKEIRSCNIDVYIATNSSTKPTVTIYPSQELHTFTNAVCSVESDTYFVFNNVYRCFVDVIGNVLSVTGRHLCVKASDSGAYETICWDLVFIHDDPNATDAVVRFVIPTPLPGSSFTCAISKPCRMLLYTSYNNSCQQVQSTSSGVTVFDTMKRAQTCVTEVAFQFEHVGTHDICFLSASIGYQARCFSVTVMNSAVNDVCSDTTCHNDGACITKSPDKYKCICKEGFTGVKCEQVLTSASEIALTGRSPVFTGTSAIKTISCNNNRECGFSALVIGISTGNTSPIVKGRVSSTLSNIEIRIEELPSRPDFHQTVISFIPTEVGVFDMCILTVNASGTNQDELCLEVHVEEGVMSQYGAKDMPHFVLPSLPLDSKLECELKTVCHVTFTAHPGFQHEFECIKPSLLSSDFVNTHIFSTCSSCIDESNTNASCTLDVAYRPSVQNKAENKVCIALIRRKTGVTGEDRCFTVTVRNTSKTNDMTGCQRLQCANGGFCDGHDPLKPVCFCKQGYGGSTCATSISINPPISNTTSFVGTNGGLPTGIQCRLLETCLFKFQVCGSSASKFQIGLTTPYLEVGEPVIDQFSGQQCANGTVNVLSSELGTHRFCIQHVQSGGLVDDELCPTIRITGGASSPIDQNKPHFLSPTFESGSTLACTKGENLHLKPFYTNGNSVGSLKDCPTLTESSQQPVDGVYIFPAEFLANICSSDIVYKVPSPAAAGSESKLCIKVSVLGKQGEERCIMLRVAEATHDIHPCKGVVCAANSVCVSDLEANSSICVCRNGATGKNCSQTNEPHNLPGIQNLPNTTSDGPHFDGSSSLPKNISCVAGKPCLISVPYQGIASKHPVPGSCDFNTGNVTVTSFTGSSHSLLVNVTVQEGRYRCCYQTTSDGTSDGVNVDELCFDVNIGKEDKGHINATIDIIPKFLTPTPSENSVLMCQPCITCHIRVGSALNDGRCEQVRMCGNLIAGAHVFQTQPTADKCITDVGYATSFTSGSTTFCVKSGVHGEERSFEVEIKHQTEFGICQKLHCLNGGKCVSTESNATCQCPFGYGGKTCEVATSTTMSNTTQSQASSIDSGGNSIGGTTMLPYVSSCNFDNDTNCIWHNVHAGDNFNWTLHQGETPSENTGPTYDHTTGTPQGKYYYIETSAPRQANETAWLESEYIASSNGEAHCLEFWYYMFGTSIGYLNVRLSENTTVPGYNIWSMEGNQGPKWIFAQVPVTTDGLNRIIFEGTVGNGYEGDIALDDVSFKQGNCFIATKITSVASRIVTSTVPTTRMPALIGQGCYGDPCVRGVCYVHFDEYFCLCPSGFNGINCEIDTDECRSAPCKNGATCEDGIDKFICHCPDGYTGHLCETYMDPCNSNPCVRGKCFSHLKLHICICPAGYSGQFCERHFDHCASHPCENNGRCKNVNSSYTCECRFGFSGQDCSKEHGTKCFACKGSKLDSICNTVTTCNSDESCYVDTFLDGDGSIRYHAGCRQSSNCMPYTGDNCTHCCDTDYCNDNGCGLTGYHPASQRGPICFDCDDMTDMTFCKQITQCAPDEMCTVYGSPSMNYDSKCISKDNQCDAQGGNRFCQFCCIHDMCNQNCTKH
ncbi:uncharacterized protein LOC127863655 isoform X2 [Dreissena polymorpha]|uniref:uncharacterized protein LOC127863655 isoform X2 n=1 Tax=Dreissena polymorpha TaxID=45954 RepID=UPI002263F60A|nr:uncharacterized protein LOC127863655 isoform X2 [Dreissena polymorpha]